MNDLKSFASFTPEQIALFVGSTRPAETPFEIQSETYKIGILNRVLHEELYDLNDFDTMVAFKLCGGGYRRTGNMYPAVKLFASFYHENDEKTFVKQLFSYYNEAVEEKEATHGDTDMQYAMRERMLDMGYLAKAVLPRLANRKLKKELSKFVRYMRHIAKRLNKGLFVKVEL